MSGFPGQGQSFQAPQPQAGGFAPVAPMGAPQAPQGFAPQPGGGFVQPQQPVYQQPQAPVTYAQPVAAPAGFAPHQAQGLQPQATRPLISESELAALRGAQMGRGKRESLPVGDYVVTGEQTEFFDANAGKGGGRPNRALALLFTVESSTVETIRPGHRAKSSEFLDTEYDPTKQLETFKQFVGRLHGVQSADQLDAMGDWLTPVMQPSSEVFRGARYAISVRQVLDRSGRPKINKRGNAVTRDMIQRIG